jgi:hypothetical protein
VFRLNPIHLEMSTRHPDRSVNLAAGYMNSEPVEKLDLEINLAVIR